MRVISGTGGVTQEGDVLRFSAAQTYTGPTQINGSSILVLPSTVSNGLSASTVVTIASGGSLDLESEPQQIAGLAGAGTVYSYGSSAGSLTLGTPLSQTYTFSGTLGGAYPDFAVTVTL